MTLISVVVTALAFDFTTGFTTPAMRWLRDRDGRVFAPARVIAADPARCVQTVQPLAGALHTRVRLDPAFSAGGYAAQPKRAFRRFGVLARSGDNVVVCSQGEVIPDLLARLAQEHGLRLPSLDTRNGGMWALSFARGRLLVADYFADYFADSRA